MKRETPKQFSARRLRLAIERSKVAVMEAQEQAQAYRGNPTSFLQLLDAAFCRLDTVWGLAADVERMERDK